MRVEIKKVRACPEGEYGNFYLLRGDKARITLSRKRNTSLAQTMVTLLHELLHLFFALSAREGFKVSDRLEHRMIYDIEAIVTRILKRYIKDGKPRRRRR